MERGYKRFGDDSISMDKITENLTRQDGKEFVGDALEKSVESIDSLPSDNSEALVLTEITNLFLNFDLIYLGKKFGENAYDSTRGINIVSEKAKTLSRLASTFAENDFQQISDKIFEEAWNEAKSIKEEGKKIETFISIIEDQIEERLIKKAESNLDDILPKAMDLTEREGDVVPLAMVTETMAKIKKDKAEELCDKVLEYSEDIKSKDDLGWAISSVAKAFSRMGKHEKSMDLMKGLISSGIYSDIQLVEVGITLSDEDQTEKALDLRNKIKNQGLKDTLTGKIASDLIKKNSVERALKLLKDIEDGFESDLVLKNLTTHFAMENSDKARRYLQKISSSEMKALAYSELANSHLRRDHRHKAKQLALKALEVIGDSSSESIRVELIETLLNIGLEDKAVELAEDIKTFEERAIAFGSIAAGSYNLEDRPEKDS